MKLFAVSILFFFCFNQVLGQELEQTALKSFLIIQSTKSYDKALKKAQLACNKLSLTLDLRNLIQDKNKGLTSNEVCECSEKHGYIPRGRFDDGNYISIEFSSAYESFSPGYYIVVVASGYNEAVNLMLPKVKVHYKNAYIKNSKVYMGCMH